MHCVEQFKVRFEEFAYALCREAGKPIKDARGEVTRLIDTFEIAAEEAVRLYGEYAPLDISERNKGIQSIVRRFPIGVVSMVSPFNFPLNLAAHKIAPAIAAGCPFVLKPASKTPIGALMIAEVLAGCADFPRGACSVITCDRKVGDMFVQVTGRHRPLHHHRHPPRPPHPTRPLHHPRVQDERLKLLSFTGSPQVGWDMKARCGKKKVVLELGGNAACIVDSWDEATQVTRCHHHRHHRCHHHRHHRHRHRYRHHHRHRHRHLTSSALPSCSRSRRSSIVSASAPSTSRGSRASTCSACWCARTTTTPS